MADNTMTLYLYFTYSKDLHPDGYSLYSVDISMASQSGCTVKQPQLVVQLPLKTRSRMACAKLGSKFYFLGGITIADEQKNVHLPSDVMIYDPADPNNSGKEAVYRVKQGTPMNFGKLDPITFEVNGKLYVLGTRQPYHLRLEGANYLFEEYDPAKDCWKVLEGPPVEEIRGYKGFFSARKSFVVSSSRVLIGGNFGETIFSFDPLNHKWTKLFKPCGGFSLQSLFVEDSFYGVSMHGGRVTKLGPCSFFEDEKKIVAPYFSQVRVEWGRISPVSRSYIDKTLAELAICHLGDRIFCAIETAPGCVRYPGIYEYVPDPFRRLLNLIIYEEIRGNPSSFNLKCLQQASFSFPAEFSSIGELNTCYVMTAEEKNKRIQVDEKKFETNLQGEAKKKKENKRKKKNRRR